MLFQSVTADIMPLAQGHCGAGQLQAAITDVRDDLTSALRDLQQAPERCERHITADALIAEGSMYQRPAWG
jgi:hypothetical protein